MKPSHRLTLAVVVIFLITVGFLWIGNRRGTSAAAKFKAELRAKGEKISFAELGFPRQPEKPDGLTRLTNAVSRIPTGKFYPGSLSVMTFVGPGRARVSWADADVMVNGTPSRIGWDELNTNLDRIADELAEIRTAAGQPAKWFLFDPTNFPNPKYPFVTLRTAAQWLMADTISALHANDYDRARADLHALAGLTEFNREDPTLVAQMIRVAIAGLTSSLMWEALQSPRWTEASLASLQDDFEKVELMKGAEAAFLGERAIGELFFAEIREHGALRTQQRFRGSPTNQSIRAGLEAMGEAFMWNLTGEADELQLLQHYQGSLECLRRLQQQEPWPEVQVKLQSLDTQLQAKLSGPQRFRYPICSILIPNFIKASQTVARNETQRRLTIAVLAIKRHQLRHERLPAELKDLVPDFLASVPIDPMSGQPLRYRPDKDGSFLLYSIGEDGKDDHGNATPLSPAKPFDLWAGKDAVWPTPETVAKAQ